MSVISIKRLLQLSACLSMAALIITLAPTLSLAASTYWWVSGPGDWFDGSNWNPSLPGAGIDAYVNNGGAPQISSGTATAQNLNLGSGSSSSGSLSFKTDEADSLNVIENFIVGGDGLGYVNQGHSTSPGNGTVNAGQSLIIGNANNAQGLYDMYSGSLNVGGSMSLGNGGQALGQFYLYGGSVQVNNYLNLGSFNNSKGTFYQSSGNVTVNYWLYVGSQGGEGTYFLGYTPFPINGDPILLKTQQIAIGGNGKGRIVQNGPTTRLETITLDIWFGPGNSYHLLDGVLQSYNTTVGVPGGPGYNRANFTQDGGTHNVNLLNVGAAFHTPGEYYLNNGRLEVLEDLSVGKHEGHGLFFQSGGELIVSSDFIVGKFDGQGDVEQSGGTATAKRLFVGHSTPNARYLLSGDATLKSSDTVIGYSNSGGFRQLDTSVHETNRLTLGFQFDGEGGYDLFGGTLKAGVLTVGYQGTGWFEQSLGSFLEVTQDFTVGKEAYSHGDFHQHSGTVSTPRLRLAPNSETYGKYRLDNGELHVSTLHIGPLDGTKDFNRGEFRMRGGLLQTVDLIVGSPTLGPGTGTGRLDILNPEPTTQINVSGSFTLGQGSEFSAVPGAVIHMTGSHFHNLSQDAANVDMSNLKMVFGGDTLMEDHFEVAGKDLGPTMDGFLNNFALDTLELLGTPEKSWVKLFDIYDNSAGGEPEALYVAHLILGLGSLLDLNGLHLYYLDFQNNGGLVQGSAPQQVVPLPSSLLLLATGVTALFAIRRRRN